MTAGGADISAPERKDMKNYLLSKGARDETAEYGIGDDELRAERRRGGAEARTTERTAADADGAAQVHSATAKATFVYLGVVVANDTIYRLSGLGRRTGILGPLAGATAEVADGTSRRTLPRVLSVVGALSNKTSAAAFVVTADGELARHKLDGAIPVRQAQAQTIKFNALVRRSAFSHPSGS
jgi:hypothetical protein